MSWTWTSKDQEDAARKVSMRFDQLGDEEMESLLDAHGEVMIFLEDLHASGLLRRTDFEVELERMIKGWEGKA